jgi:hypothetical protein
VEKSGHNTLIRLASCYEAVHDDLVVLRLLYFLRIILLFLHLESGCCEAAQRLAAERRAAICASAPAAC